jgi:hypothetical protein
MRRFDGAPSIRAGLAGGAQRVRKTILGDVAERPKALVSKTRGAQASESSNLSISL